MRKEERVDDDDDGDGELEEGGSWGQWLVFSQGKFCVC